MTPPADHPPAAPPVDQRPVLRVRDQGELVAAVPAMLGFHPRESLVLMATGGLSGRRLGLTLRVDLPPPEHPQYAEHAELVVASAVCGLLLDEPTGAVAVVVSESGDPPGPLPHSLLAGRVESALAAQQVPIRAVMWTERTTGGARWACYQACGCAGTVPDPATTPFVAAVVAEGKVVHADRAALEAVVAPVDQDVLRRREKRLIQSVDGQLEGDTGAVVLEPDAGVFLVDAAIADSAAGRLALSDDDVVALATALGIAEVRGWALQRTAGPGGAAAEHLWAALVRETPDPEAAEPAALLAVSALLRGDGALANIALDRAERAWPGHAFAGLVRRCAAAGVRPSQVRDTLLGGPTRDAR
ncbi:DUF4192 domain-containing protein [Pseudonocardia adelaidensis]|uniref:DUF4192 domain-containing protein n=1 Tax=Pseudonocardia adelaidensis TaxID=648754 RepID=A0ABP9P6R8_9PSEU